MIRLIVNADDFGFTPDVNDGILEAHRNGILTATTMMANGAAFEHAAEIARANRTLDVGCHLTLIGGNSVLEPSRALPVSAPDLLLALARKRIPVYDEFRAQMVKITNAGIVPTHLDTHKHTHIVWPVLSAVVRVAREFGARWVRRPFDFVNPNAAVPLATRLANFAMQPQRRYFHRVLAGAGLRSTDYFAGFQLTGHMDTPQLLELLQQLPEGSTELMCHPGYYRTELANAATRLKATREVELRALTSPEAMQIIKQRGIQLSAYA